ncbi:unnamed protein product [marine sediment metagenome]|uniref:Uncharacterized protein n=1 Tax=marine sediment metagenome TaxID=412755 RepID=X1M4T2_9ZZZZ
MISRDPMDDRDRIKRGKKLERATGKQAKRLVFRNVFIDGQDAKMARILWNYFEAVEERWPEAWESEDLGNILPRTNGFAALMRFFVPVYTSFDRPDEIIDKAEFGSIFEQSELADDCFTRDNYVPGTSGQTKLYRNLMKALPQPSDLFSDLD